MPHRSAHIIIYLIFCHTANFLGLLHNDREVVKTRRVGEVKSIKRHHQTVISMTALHTPTK